MLASKLLMPAVQIYGVIDFYTFLHRKARGDFDILFSDNITDRMLGNQSLIGNLCEKLHIEPGVPQGRRKGNGRRHFLYRYL